MVCRALNNNQELQLCEMFSSHKSMFYIANFFSVSRTTVRNILKRHEVYVCRRRLKPLTPQQELDLCETYLNQKGLSRLSERYGVGWWVVVKVLKQHGVPLRNRKKFVDESFFKNINTPVKAYWLGFLTADGYTNGTSTFLLNLSSVDEKHVFEFRNALNSDCTISRYIRNKRSYIYLCISNGVFVSHLKKFLNRDKVVSLSNGLLSHFGRGLIDGDGCICLYKPKDGSKCKLIVNLLAKKSFLLDLNTLLPVKTSAKLRLHSSPSANVCEMRFNGCKALALLNWLYKDSTEDTRLARKYDRYLKALGMARAGKLSGFS